MHLTDSVYRALGVIASVNRRLWLIRVNFIPLNVAVMVLLGAGVFVGLEQVVDAASNQRTAVPQTLAVLLSAGEPKQSYVTIQGRLYADAPLEYGTEGTDGKPGKVERSWAPLLDEGTGKVLMVELARNRPQQKDPEDTALTGMLRPLPPHLRKYLSDNAFKHRGVIVESRFMLVEGEQPAQFAANAFIASACGLLLLAFAAAMFWRNVVFRSDGGATPDALATMQADGRLLVSGRLFLNEKTSQFFSNMPAAMGTVETGETVIVSNIDASSRFMGVKTSDRAGLWTMTFRPGTLQDAEEGHVFDGWTKRRAIRFRYINDVTGRQERAVVAMA
jgi:hypothetical protein